MGQLIHAGCLENSDIQHKVGAQDATHIRKEHLTRVKVRLPLLVLLVMVCNPGKGAKLHHSEQS